MHAACESPLKERGWSREGGREGVGDLGETYGGKGDGKEAIKSTGKAGAKVDSSIRCGEASGIAVGQAAVKKRRR